MKNLSTFLLLPLVLFLSSCGKDDDVAADPEGTVTVNLLNEQNGKIMLGKSNVYINNANNFFTSSDFISDAGKASGVGAKIEPQLNGLAQEVAVTPEHAYQIFDKNSIYEFPSGKRAIQIEVDYYQVYVVSPINNNNITTGAVIKYVSVYPDTKGLPQLGQTIGRLADIGSEIEYKIPQNAECYLRGQGWPDGDKNGLNISTTGNKLIVRLTKEPNEAHGPYGDYDIYVRSGNVFTIVNVKAGRY